MAFYCTWFLISSVKLLLDIGCVQVTVGISGFNYFLRSFIFPKFKCPVKYDPILHIPFLLFFMQVIVFGCESVLDMNLSLPVFVKC